jgi:hypothetical protein
MPKNLCGYVWALIGRGFLGLFLLFLLACSAFVVVVTKGIVLLPVLGILGLAVGVTFFVAKCAKSNNFFFVWLRAKKQRMCPVIEYVNRGNK